MTKLERNFYNIKKGALIGVLYLTNKNVNKLKKINNVMFNLNSDAFYEKLPYINDLQSAKKYQDTHLNDWLNYQNKENRKTLFFDTEMFYDNINLILNPVLALANMKKNKLIAKYNEVYDSLYRFAIQLKNNDVKTNELSNMVFASNDKSILSKEQFDCVIYADASYSSKKKLSQCMITIKDQNKKYYYDIVPDLDQILINYDSSLYSDMLINEFLAIYYSLFLALNVKNLKNKKICILNDNAEVVKRLSLLLNDDKDFTYYHLLNHLKEFLANKIFQCEADKIKDEFIISFYDVLNKYSNLDITFSWIKGHNNCFGNIIADSIKLTVKRQGDNIKKIDTEKIMTVKF